MLIQPYLFFDGCCEQALDFYRAVLGAEVTMLMRYRECPDPLPPDMLQPGSEDKVMHASMTIGDSVVMASDNVCPEATDRRMLGFSLSLSLTDQDQARRLFAALAEDGEVQMALDQTFWSPLFGMVTDRFGVSWMINVVA